jgi:GTPase SAR1 family protein
LSDGDRADVALMDALAEREPPQRVHVVGPSGAGKTSLILRVVADLAKRELEVRHEVLILRDDVLTAAAADQRTQTPKQLEHRGGLKVPIVGYSASIKQGYETLAFGQNSARVRHDLQDVLGQVRAAGFRPVLVLESGPAPPLRHRPAVRAHRCAASPSA